MFIQLARRAEAAVARAVEILLRPGALAFYDPAAGKWKAEAGDYEFELRRWPRLENRPMVEGIPGEKRVGVRFDCGRAYEAIGDLDRARAAYENVRADDASFPGIAERLAGLGSGGPPPADSAPGARDSDCSRAW